jgi:predicted transcriptional regulator
MLRYCQYRTILKFAHYQYRAMDSLQTLMQKGATCSDLLSCLYNLKPIDLQVFAEVAKLDHATLDQISIAVDRDRSSTHRCLAKLVSACLINKQTKTMRDGGYYHVYSIVEPSEIKREARRKVSDVIIALQALIDNFEVNLLRQIKESKQSVR